MILSDTLSRRPDHCPEEDNDNKDVVMLPDGLFLSLLDINFQMEIAKSTNYDFDVANILKSLLEEGPSILKQDLSDWSVEEFDGANVMFYRGKNYIPKNEELRRKILALHHDHEMAGHPGELETFNSVSKGFWWPGLRSYMKNYVKGCGVCQQFKIDQSPSRLAFIPTEGAKTTRPFSCCSMDLITDLPLSDGYDLILVIVDQGLTKGVILLPCSKTITSEQVGKLL